MRKLLTVIIIIIVLGFLAWRQYAPIKHVAGVLVRAEPTQTMLVTSPPPLSKNGWVLKPLAVFSLEARVLGVKFYTDDFSSTISSCDLALGWGPMSDSAVLDRLDISQQHRFYRWRFWGQAPIPEKEIVTHSANMHLIPADESILGKLKSLRQGSLIRLSGNLVEATHPQGERPWRSSLARDDTGEGACEIFYVKSLTVR